jgi:hypothetical protein
MLATFSSTLSVQIPLSLELPLAYTVRFVPMKLGLPDSTIARLHQGYNFELSLSSSPVNSMEPRDGTDPTPYGYDLDMGDLSDYLEVHRGRASLFSSVTHPIQAGEDPGRVAAA